MYRRRIIIQILLSSRPQVHHGEKKSAFFKLDKTSTADSINDYNRIYRRHYIFHKLGQYRSHHMILIYPEKIVMLQYRNQLTVNFISQFPRTFEGHDSA